jgi:hypothetical protein
MRLHVLPLAAALLAACSGSVGTAVTSPQPPPATPAATTTVAPSPIATIRSTPRSTPLATAQIISTIVAAGPVIDVFFDGTVCAVDGPSEVPTGGLVVRFTNATGPGHLTTPWVGRLYEGKTWQDYVDWLGAPGSYHSDTPEWYVIPGILRQAWESPTVSYRQYNLTVAGEYNLTMEYPGEHWYACAPFYVVASP